MPTRGAARVPVEVEHRLAVHAQENIPGTLIRLGVCTLVGLEDGHHHPQLNVFDASFGTMTV